MAFSEISRIGKFIDSESNLVVVKVWEEGRIELLNVSEFFWGGTENILKLDGSGDYTTL